MSLKKITLEQIFHCISFQDLHKHDRPMKNSPNNDFSILIGYFTRDNHRDISIPSHFQCNLLMYASFSNTDVKIPHHYLTRVPEYYRSVSTWYSSTRKRQTIVVHRDNGYLWLSVYFHAILALQYAAQLLSF